MRVHRCIAVVVTAIVALASGVSAQESQQLSDPSNREAWRGVGVGAETALSMDRGEVSAGDSRRDLIVGAPGWNANRGRVYVVFSGPTRNGETSLASADVIISGAADGDRFGEVTAAGYITAKEATAPLPSRDLVIGAPGVNANSGAVYVYQRDLTGGSLTTSNALVTIGGAPAGAKLGTALSTGDLDGDGYREIIIGAPGIGAVYVVHGGPTIAGTIDLSTPSSAFFKIQGSAADGVGQVLAAGDLLGHALAGNNTIYDLAIGAPFENSSTGGVYVITGRGANTFPATMNLATEANAHFIGIEAGDQAGRSLQIAPIDRDRYSDLLIGAPKAGGPGNSRPLGGEIYGLWGGPTVSSRSLSASDLFIFGAAAGYEEGTQLAFGDVNRDGTADFVSLAPGAGAAGELHLFNGRVRAAWGAGVDLLFTPEDRRVFGDPAHGVMRSSVIVDMTGEGFDDVAGGYPADAEGYLQIGHSVGVTITQSPRSRTINPDVMTTFVAAADGAPAPAPQWQVSTDGTTWTNIPGATQNTFTFLAHTTDNGKFYRVRYSSSVNSGNSEAAQLTVRASAIAARPSDFDGNGTSDLAIWRPSDNTFYTLTSPPKQWGVASIGDRPLSADMDGDGIVDYVVWRPGNGTFFWLTSGSGFSYSNAGSRALGSGDMGDIPMLADMDGDKRADLVVWRPGNGTFYWMPSTTNYAVVRSMVWGSGSVGDQPMLGDFDGDGKADLIVWRPGSGMWYWLTSSSDYTAGFGVAFGSGSVGDIPLIGDIDGDGRTEVTVWRPGNGTFYWLNSAAGYTTMGSKAWGTGTLQDVPMLPDLDGDGRADLTVWRPGNGMWYWLTSSSSYTSGFGVAFGGPGDIPIK